MTHHSSPGLDDNWEQDAETLLAEFGDVWEIVRSSDNPLILVCTRERGTESHVIAGRPRACLDRIRALPAGPPPGPVEVRTDAGGWISGPMSGPTS